MLPSARNRLAGPVTTGRPQRPVAPMLPLPLRSRVRCGLIPRVPEALPSRSRASWANIEGSFMAWSWNPWSRSLSRPLSPSRSRATEDLELPRTWVGSLRVSMLPWDVEGFWSRSRSEGLPDWRSPCRSPNPLSDRSCRSGRSTRSDRRRPLSKESITNCWNDDEVPVPMTTPGVIIASVASEVGWPGTVVCADTA